MAPRFLFLSFAWAFLLLSSAPARGQNATGQNATAKISGTVLYRQRIALSPDAVVEVTLEDVSLGDAPSNVIARQRIPTAGKQVPIPFTLTYRTSAIVPAHRYQLRARITQGGNLLFISTRAYPVFADAEAPGRVELMVDQVPPSAVPPPTGHTTAHPPLEGTYWKLIELYDKPIAPSSGPNEVHIELDAAGKTFSGSSGCNRLVGSYVKNGDDLRFRSVASTMMMCPGMASQEQSVNKALQETIRFRINGQMLVLSDGHETVARFEARPVK